MKQAWRMGFHGLSAALAVMWDTQLSPGDVRALRAGQRRSAPDGATWFVTRRGKTDVSVGGIISRRSAAVLDAYLAGLGAELHPDAELFRSRGAEASARGGRPWAPRPYTKDCMAEDFREVRTALFGAGESRQMLDMRRSGAAEAIAGRATAEQLTHSMGNTIASSNALFKTYAPAELTNLRAVAEARRKGRATRRDGNKSG
ncbi:hypothetical protein ACIKT0_01740 [Hansschlegelia beijingensis]|uniref:hypothetical protein n=1 Tax=Hansschlegelia beijingensis TaxID=1133344 RepID=UPI00387F08FF